MFEASSSDTMSDAIELRSDPVSRDIIDVNDGLERVMGNRELYGRMLRRFKRDYHSGALPIRTALAEGDLRTAHLLAHTLKGAAGMIGAQQLHDRAAQLDIAVRDRSAHIRELLASLVPEFDRVLMLLEVMLEGSPPPGMPVIVPTRPLPTDAALIERFTTLLSEQDGAAVDLLEENEASLKVILGAERLARVALAVNDFAFDEALAALGENAGGGGI